MSYKCLVDENSYIMGMLAPSMLIIVVLSFMKKRVRLKPNLLNGRPGLLSPVSFLGKERNRLIIVLAFGATASSCYEMFTYEAVAIKNVPNTPYGKAFNGIFLSLLYGIINYPYLACLNAEYRLIGYAIGLLYTFIRCTVDLVVIFGCTSDSKEIDDFLTSYKLLVHLPSVICTILLFASYAIFLFQEIRKIYANNAHPTCQEIFLIGGERDEPVAEDIDRNHVSLLLANKLYSKRVLVEHEPWYITVRRKIYETRPDFKFSTQFMSAVFVSLIFIYQIAATLMHVLAFYKKILGMITGNPIVQRMLKTFFDYYQIAVIMASVIATLQIFMFIKSHRSDVLKTYRTRSGQLPDEHMNPKVIVGKSLRFCGYQIAFTGVGMIFVTISVLFPLLFILALKYADEIVGISAVTILKEIVLFILPAVIVPFLIWLALLLLCTFVFRDRTYPDLTVTIDNRRLFDIMSYFFFFLNILVGIWSGLSRVAKGAALGLVFLCRLDRTSMMTGYRKWDRGYMAYIGFLNVLVAFRHPVMLCFCQVLIDERKKLYSGLITSDRPRRSTRALNRWFLAVLLTRNPSLLRYRKRDVFGSRDTYSSATAADMSAVVLEEWEMPSEKLKSTQFY